MQVIKLLIKNFLFVDVSSANLLKKKYLQAFFSKTDVNNITQSDEFKRLTLTFEIVSGLVGDNKEHEVKKFLDDEIKKLFRFDGIKNSLLRFINSGEKSKITEFNINSILNKNDNVNKLVGNFKNTLSKMAAPLKTESIKKFFDGVKPDFD